MGFSRQEYWSGLPFPPPGATREAPPNGYTSLLPYLPARQYPSSFPTFENVLQFFLSYYNVFMSSFSIFKSHQVFLSCPLGLRYQSLLESTYNQSQRLSPVSVILKFNRRCISTTSQERPVILTVIKEKIHEGESPGSPVVETLCFQSRGHESDS